MGVDGFGMGGDGGVMIESGNDDPFNDFDYSLDEDPAADPYGADDPFAPGNAGNDAIPEDSFDNDDPF